MKIIELKGRPPQQLAAELGQAVFRFAAEQEATVRKIVEAVRTRGEDALLEYTQCFDWPNATSAGLAVTDREMAAAKREAGDEFLFAVRRAAANVRRFHEKQIPTDWFLPTETGALLGQKYTPIQRVGVHVPGFTAAYPSSLIMTVVPAQVAGVEEIVLVTPPNKQGRLPAPTLATASELGLKRIIKVGGAQAIAALAFGTKSVPKVDKIVGPGNIWVTLAKKMVYGEVGIDGLYGPSEVAVIADESADPKLVSADLLAQAEHGSESPVYLITPHKPLIASVQVEITRQLRKLSRRDTAEKALADFGAFILTNDLKEACALVNELAPEHAQLMVRDPFSLLGELRNAGCLFLGMNSPVPLGDYVIGPSHVLPTARTARFSSGLGTLDFFKRTSLVHTPSTALEAEFEALRTLAEQEGFKAHLRAVELRLPRRKGKQSGDANEKSKRRAKD